MTNRGPDAAPLHVLPTLWFRQHLVWGRDDRAAGASTRIETPARRRRRARGHPRAHHELGEHWLACGGRAASCSSPRTRPTRRGCGAAEPRRRTSRTRSTTPWSQGARRRQPRARRGTKAAAHYRLHGRAGRDAVGLAPPVRRTRSAGALAPTSTRSPDAPGGGRRVLRHLGRSPTCPTTRAGAAPGVRGPAVEQAVLRTTTSRTGSTAIRRSPPPPPERRSGRNAAWRHLYNSEVLSMPDKWEYPWYAAWDLAFHCIPLALVDPEFAKEQLILLLREWYMHPNGQLARVRVGVRRREPAGARVGRAGASTRSRSAITRARPTGCSSSASSTSCCSTSRGG